jgi:hypothetical protein
MDGRGKVDVTGGLSSKSAESRASRFRLLVKRAEGSGRADGGLRRVVVRGVLSLEKAERSASLPSSIRTPAGVLGGSFLTRRVGWDFVPV